MAQYGLRPLLWCNPVRCFTLVNAVLVLTLLSAFAAPAVCAEPTDTAPSAESSESTAASNQPLRMTVRAIEKQTGKPIPNASIEVKAYYDSGEPLRETRNCNAEGELLVELPAEPPIRWFYIDGRASGMVKYHVSWTGTNNRIEFPTEYVMAFEPSTSIGGTVLDTEGKPIEGARVEILCPATDSDHLNYSYHLDEGLKTDAEGKWKCNKVPADFSTGRVRIEHPDYLFDFIDLPQNLAAMRDQSFVKVMRQGPSLTGRVVDAQGRPVAGASLLLGTSTYDSNKRTATTDEQGHFKLTNCEEELQILCTTAAGHSPDLRKQTVAQENAPLEIQLEPPSTLRARIVDKQGQLVADAQLNISSWRGYQVLQDKLAHEDDGSWVWKNAPRDAVQFSVWPGNKYLKMYDVPLTASEEEQVVTVLPRFTIRGHVTDAATGQPIKEFRVYSAWQALPTPRFDKSRLTNFNDGEYAFEFDHLRNGYALRVEAEGYTGADSEVFFADNHPETIDFKLTNQDTIEGVVQLPDGSAAEGATVVLLSASDGGFTQFKNGRFGNNPYVPSVVTKSDGRYRLARPTVNYQLVVLHDRGYCDTLCKPSSEPPVLQLKPWGRIEGTLKIGSGVGANQPMRFSPRSDKIDRQSRLYHSYEFHTDADGHFTIDRVVPGEGLLSQTLITVHGSGSTHSSKRSEEIVVQPGETTRVTLGGSGRPVLGKAIAIMPDGKPVKWEDNEPVLAKRKDPSGDTQWFRCPIALDGSFRGEDLPAGDYTLSVQLTPPRLENRCGFGEAIGTGSITFTIPEMPGGRSDEPLDVGEVPITLLKTTNVGDVAPDFTLDELNGGGTRTLASLRGKLVLLDFWATWCGPCLAEMPNMKALHDELGDRDDFVILGISVDQTAEPAQKYVTAEGYAWKQLWARNGIQAAVGQDYGVRAIPATFLIAPDGKVIAKDLRGRELADAVKEALGTAEKTASKPDASSSATSN